MKKISIIIVTMNHLNELKKLLESIKLSSSRDFIYDIFIIDNCSTDGTIEFVNNFYPDIVLLSNKYIQGFAQNVNIGLKISDGDYILILNPDIILFPDSIEELFKFMESNPQVGLAGPLLLNLDNSVQYSARKFLDFKVLINRLITLGSDRSNNKYIQKYLMKNIDRNQPQPVDWVTGAAMFVRREAIKSVGLMDEKFFLYMEDQDWCLRFWESGWLVYYVPSSKMIHGHKRESIRKISKKTFFHLKSIIYFLYKNRKSLKRYKNKFKN